MHLNNDNSERKPTRRLFLKTVIGAALLPSTAFAMGKKVFLEKKSRPNVIVILMDDLGYGDIGTFGCPDIPTPNIDKLAEEGVKCTNGYTMCPVCSPSRTALITGMYTQRFGVYGNWDRGTSIPEDHPTMAEFMRNAGYVTGMVGRWDIGSREQGPLNEGFMEVARRSQIEPEKRVKPNYPTYFTKDGTYWTDQQGNEMVDFVNRHKGENFFLYFAPLAVHFPVEEAPKRYLDRVSHIKDKKRRFLAATLVAADDAIGKLMAELKKHKLDENTLIFFTSDNGGELKDHARNLPYRGGKSSEWDGAVHEPYIVRWKGTVPAGKTFEGLVSTLDIYATSAAVTGKKIPEHCDGVNILPYLRGDKKGHPNEAIYFSRQDGEDNTVFAMRHKNWRLMKPEKEHPWRLYDIENDPGEKNDLADQNPRVVKKLANMYNKWLSQMAKPQGLQQDRTGGLCPGGKGWATPEDSS